MRNSLRTCITGWRRHDHFEGEALHLGRGVRVSVHVTAQAPRSDIICLDYFAVLQASTPRKLKFRGGLMP